LKKRFRHVHSKIAWLVLLLFVMASITQFPEAFADMGGFSPAGYSVFEEAQKAIIAWNGTDEILILSTDVKASQETSVVRLIPLPAEPSVEKGTKSSFSHVQSLIRYFYDFYGAWVRIESTGLAGWESLAQLCGVDIVFHDEIGAHSITVVRADVAEELISWIEGFLSDLEIEYSELPSELEGLVSQYLDDEIRYFVLDVITVSSDVKSVEPLTYTFKTTSLYYPLTITSLFSGDTEISLCTLTSGELADDAILEQGFDRKVRFRVKLGTLSKIDSALSQMFTSPPYLCLYKHSAPVSSFRSDIGMNFFPIINLAPLFRVHPLLATITIAIGVTLTFGFLLIRKRRSILDTAIDLSIGTSIFVAIVLSIDFLIIWWLNLTSEYLELLGDVYLWRSFLTFESIAMMLFGAVGHWGIPRSHLRSTSNERKTRVALNLRHSWFWFSLTTAGFVLFTIFVYLSS